MSKPNPASVSSMPLLFSNCSGAGGKDGDGAHDHIPNSNASSCQCDGEREGPRATVAPAIAVQVCSPHLLFIHPLSLSLIFDFSLNRQWSR
jgi:hypothetical protein